jgi:Holin of 3TMs, for gene-transfer release
MTFGIGDAVAAGLKVIDKFIPDPEAKVKAEKELRESLQSWDKMQADVNLEEAKHNSLFVAGWRPALGWTCAFAFAFIYVLGPLITWLSTMAGNPIPLPSFNIEALMGLTLGMLGLGGLRTFEKVKGVSR